MKILVTGTAGFIGFHLAERLLNEGHIVVGLDSISDYYDVHIKYGRLALQGIDQSRVEYNKPVQSNTFNSYRFIQLQLEDKTHLETLFRNEGFDSVINLAAQAGVRYSLTNPQAYINSNIVGFVNLLECCRHHHIKHLVYASSSSVYGLNETVPFSTSQNVDHPVSLYAASKKSNELMAHVYSHLYHIPTTGLRFFTVYGPWGRPDMALFLFTKAILEGRPIQVFNQGEMVRDFTYIDDIVEGIFRVMNHPPEGNTLWDAKQPDPSNSKAPYKLYNIGNNNPVRLMDFVSAIENELGRVAIKEFLPLQMGDVPVTSADITDLEKELNYKPSTTIHTGIKNFINWYKNYFTVN